MKKAIEVTPEELEAVKVLLKSMNENVDREGLAETPKRYIKFLKQFCNPDEFNMTVFENESKKSDMIIVSEIPFYSLCEHHLAPFFGTAAIAYVPNEKIVGLSKIPRTLDHFSNRPQNQERITNQVSAYLMEKLKPKGVGVIIKARHLCVEMRGVKKPGCITTTSSMEGCFNELNCRQEFLNLIKF
jgi:GTP cyclohydrolase I